MSALRRIVRDVCFCLVSIISNHGLVAQAAYTFTSIADNTGIYLDFNSPSINPAGTVAFRASLDGGGGGIYRGTTDGVTPLAELGSVFQSIQFQTPGIDADGNVSFTAARRGEAGGGTAVFISGANSTSIYAITPTTNPPVAGDYADFQSTVMNTEGVPAFFATFLGAPGQGLRGGVFADNERIADDLGSFLSFGDSLGKGLDVNNHLDVVFKAVNDDNTSGIYLYSDGGVTPIAETTAGFVGFNFSVPAINDAGDIVFWAEPSPFIGALYTASASGDGPNLFVDQSGPFGAFGTSPAINELGEIAFTARLDVSSQGNGIFTGPDSVLDKVIEVGDPLFGSTFGEAAISNASINDAGQIAFRYTLGDGRTGIAVATPVTDSPTADFDGDNDVDGKDFLLWQRGFGAPSASRAQGDADGNQTVDGDDLAIWQSQYGAQPLTFLNVPEPGTFTLLSATAAILRSRRSRCAHR